MKAGSSFARLQAASLLQSAYGGHHIRAFEHAHQLVEDTLTVLRSGLKVFFQYELRFANGLNSQLLISHEFNSQTKRPRGKQEREIKTLFRNVPAFLRYQHQFLFQRAPVPGWIAASSPEVKLLKLLGFYPI
jgi:hypothetical protein